MCVCFVISVAANVDNLCLASYVHTQCGIDYAAAEMLLILCYRCYTFYGCQYVVWSILLCVVFFPSSISHIVITLHCFISFISFALLWHSLTFGVLKLLTCLLAFCRCYCSISGTFHIKEQSTDTSFLFERCMLFCSHMICGNSR